MSRRERTLYFVLPGARDTRTGGYLYDTRMAAQLEARGWTVEWVPLGAGFPFPARAERATARAALARLPEGALTLVDGLAFGVLDTEVAREAGRLALVALVHHPLALETGLDPRTAAALEASERRALASARRVIVTSPHTRRTLVAAPYRVAPGACAAVPPGTAPAPLARGSRPGSPLELLCVATLTPRKGHAVLLEALGRLRAGDWRLVLAGDAERDPDTARALRAQARALGIAGRVVFEGGLGECALADRYAGADLFVLASWYEGYGMALAEALARGVAVVSTRAGAIADTVPRGAGVLVEPGDAHALAAALQRFMSDAAHRDALRAGARRARQHLLDWPTAAAAFERALEAALRSPSANRDWEAANER